MLNITNFYSNIEGTISVDNTIVSKMIVDKDKYSANMTAVLADAKTFEEKVFADFANASTSDKE